MYLITFERTFQEPYKKESSQFEEINLFDAEKRFALECSIQAKLLAYMPGNCLVQLLRVLDRSELTVRSCFFETKKNEAAPKKIEI